MDYAAADNLADQYGDAFYILDESRVRANYARLSESFRRHYPKTQIAYSYKTNYTPAICRLIETLGGYAEVVSEMEWDLARRLGIAPARIIYNGPYKTPRSMAEALLAGAVVNLDSQRDLANLTKIAMEHPNTRMRVGIRCNFAVEGAYSRFGMAVEDALFIETVNDVRRLTNVTLAGLHCHFPSRSVESFNVRATRMIDLADSLFVEPPEFINIGGGFFGAMPDALKMTFDTVVPEFEDYAATVGDLFRGRYQDDAHQPTLFMEPGTALVADVLSFVTRIVDKKRTPVGNLALVTGSLFNTSPYSRSSSLPVSVLRRRPTPTPVPPESYEIVGLTCIERDVLARDVGGPLEVGDFLLFENCGSYSIVMKPPFIAPNVPILLLTANTGEFRLVKKAETADYVFQNFVF